MTEHYDAVVVGGGFAGKELQLRCKEKTMEGSVRSPY